MNFFTVLHMLLVCFVAECWSIQCQEALGMENRKIADGQISASSQWPHASLVPAHGRLYFTGGSWSARTNDVNQWLQIDFRKNTKITDVATQGRNGAGQWVTKYKLQYSVDGVNFQYYTEQQVEMEFVGNTDQDTVVTHTLTNPIIARYIRFRPTAWIGHISMRVEVFGPCAECHVALGMENGAIFDGQISASSQWPHASLVPAHGRLYFTGGSWSARTNDVNQWLQVDVHMNTKITGVATQGRNGAGQWVIKYKLQYSDDGVNFQYYMEQVVTEFVGNTDQDTVVYHALINPIIAHYIRFRPTVWHGHISMRVEVFGCTECQDALGMENGAIADGQITASSQWDANHAALQGRLNFKTVPGKAGSWSAAANNVNQWLQIDMVQTTKIAGVATQGRNGVGQWVTKYKLLYGDDGVNFKYYTVQVEMEFVGNADQDTVVYHELSNPFIAIYIRFRPIAWYGHISMRVEVFGCKAPVVSSEECFE